LVKNKEWLTLDGNRTPPVLLIAVRAPNPVKVFMSWLAVADPAAQQESQRNWNLLH
jgi:hypothetical protein